MTGTIRATFCQHDEYQPATVEVAFIPGNSGPGVSVVACTECAARKLRQDANAVRRQPTEGER